MGGIVKMREPAGDDTPEWNRERPRSGRGSAEGWPGSPAPRREAAESGNQVGNAHSPKDMLMEVPFLPFYVNFNDVCLCPTEQKGH